MSSHSFLGWDNSIYSGDTDHNLFHGYGTLEFEFVKYVGFFDKGNFSGEGDIEFPDGSHFTGEWQEGKIQKGKYKFSDGLRYEIKDWDYLNQLDRRFYHEITNRHIDPPIHSDIQLHQKYYNSLGKNYYNPLTQLVHSNACEYVSRIPSRKEIKWIINKCREF